MISRKSFTNSTIVLVLILALTLPIAAVPSGTAKAASAPEFPFPVIGQSSYSNDFDAYRELNGVHHAIDIIANKGQKIISRTDGIVTFVGYPQPNWGYSVYVEAPNGYSYRYLHINNDNPGTDDGKGGGMHAYGPDIQRNKHVVKGQLLGYVGDSGNAENTVSHLHFEVYDGDKAINPYGGLRNNSYRQSAPTSTYPKDDNEILPSTTFRGGASLAYGDVDDDGTDEIITGAGPGGKYIKVFNTAGDRVLQFAPNGPDFLGGVDVAAGDLDGDGEDEIITGAGKGGKLVKVFDHTGTQISSFAPNGDKFFGGVDVATGDLDNDGNDEIVTGAGPGGKLVKVFDGTGTQLAQFAPYGGSKWGISVATGDVSGAGLEDEIITGVRKGGGPRVSVFSLAGAELASYYAYSSTYKGGIRVESSNIRSGTPKNEIMTIAQTLGSSRVKMFAGSGSSLDLSNYFAEEWWEGYYDIAANDTSVSASLGVNRRTSVRPVTGLQF